MEIERLDIADKKFRFVEFVMSEYSNSPALIYNNQCILECIAEFNEINPSSKLTENDIDDKKASKPTTLVVGRIANGRNE